MSKTTAAAVKPLTEGQTKVIVAAEQVATDGQFTAKQVAERLGVKTNAITGTLTSLVKREEIARVAGGFYALPAKPETIKVKVTVDIPDDALAMARELINAEAAFQTTKAGSHGKVVTVGDAYVTTDGHHLTAKTGSDPKAPWILVQVPTMKLMGEFKSSSQALTLEVLGHTS